MQKPDAEARVGDLVIEQPRRAEVFEKWGIDYCCGGSATLAAACRQAGAELADVLRELEACDAHAQQRDQQQEPAVDWRQRPASELCQHIEQTHHARLREWLPRAHQMMAKVLEAHGQRHPELAEVARYYQALENELVPHLMKEEQVLFPMIRQLESATSMPLLHCGTVQNPVHVMIEEHEHAGDALKQLRRLTGGFCAPEDACPTYQALYALLADLEKDLHEHIHKENNILFPKALELERRLAESAAP